jgi:hypothetical protein
MESGNDGGSDEEDWVRLGQHPLYLIKFSSSSHSSRRRLLRERVVHRRNELPLEVRGRMEVDAKRKTGGAGVDGGETGRELPEFVRGDDGEVGLFAVKGLRSVEGDVDVCKGRR